MCTQIYLRFHICPCELRYRLEECEHGRLDPRCKHVRTSIKWTHRDYCHYHMSVRAAARAKAKARQAHHQQQQQQHHHHHWGPTAAAPATPWASSPAATPLGAAADPWAGYVSRRVYSEPWFAGKPKPKPKRQSSWWWRDGGTAADGSPLLARPLLTAAAADTRRFS